MTSIALIMFVVALILWANALVAAAYMDAYSRMRQSLTLYAPDQTHMIKYTVQQSEYYSDAGFKFAVAGAVIGGVGLAVLIIL